MKWVIMAAALCLGLTLVLSGFLFGLFLELPLDPAVLNRLQSLLASP